MSCSRWQDARHQCRATRGPSQREARYARPGSAAGFHAPPPSAAEARALHWTSAEPTLYAPSAAGLRLSGAALAVRHADLSRGLRALRRSLFATSSRAAVPSGASSAAVRGYARAFEACSLRTRGGSAVGCARACSYAPACAQGLEGRGNAARSTARRPSPTPALDRASRQLPPARAGGLGARELTRGVGQRSSIPAPLPAGRHRGHGIERRRVDRLDESRACCATWCGLPGSLSGERTRRHAYRSGFARVDPADVAVAGDLIEASGSVRSRFGARVKRAWPLLL